MSQAKRLLDADADTPGGCLRVLPVCTACVYCRVLTRQVLRPRALCSSSQQRSWRATPSRSNVISFAPSNLRTTVLRYSATVSHSCQKMQYSTLEQHDSAGPRFGRSLGAVLSALTLLLCTCCVLTYRSEEKKLEEYIKGISDTGAKVSSSFIKLQCACVQIIPTCTQPTRLINPS
jgi:hypothetical protein